MNKNPNGTWTARVRLAGKPSESKTFRRKSDALRWYAQQTLNRKSEHTARTVNHLLDRYVDKHLAHNKPHPSRACMVRFWRRTLGHERLIDLQRQHITTALESLPFKASTVNQYRQLFNAACQKAVTQWAWLDKNPCAGIPPRSQNAPRVRFLTDDERGRLLDTARTFHNKQLYPILLLALTTGMRKNEIRSLRWQYLDRRNSALHLPDTKNGEPRSVPITADVLALIDALPGPHQPDQYIFAQKGSRFTRPLPLRSPWDTIRRRAGLRNFRFHDLRHTAASYLAMDGASLATIASILGHKTLEVTKRYSHMTIDHNRTVMQSMADRYLSATTADD